MVKRIAGIIFIFVCTTVAWVILGGTIIVRTESTDARLKERVASTWGAPQMQLPPTAHYDRMVAETEESVVDGKKQTRRVERAVATPLPLEATRAEVGLDLEHRQKGLLWYSTYAVQFAGEYTFRNPTDQGQQVTFLFPFPAANSTYDNAVFLVDGKAVDMETTPQGMKGTSAVPPRGTALLKVGYNSRGLDQWSYQFGETVSQVRDFQLALRTNFDGFDFPDNTLSPTEKQQTAAGWELRWQYANLLSGVPIALAMPQKLQPGPLAGQISFFAPVSLFFFFFLMFIITTLRGIELHPMNYFFLAGAFFTFHLLLAYLVDHISIHAAFLICSAVSIFLVVSYLRLVVGMRFAAVEAGLSQFLYLVLFSYAFFFEGFTGLAITIGAILTLFVVMQMTGRIRWAERFEAAKAGAH